MLLRGRKSLLFKNTEVGMCSFTYLPHDGIICIVQMAVFEWSNAKRDSIKYASGLI